ncbi:MAG: hypothetical protein JWN46_3553 [Acidimicrobiales bacterium]|nr:hypothetical protein [Acidimicrobiales bacterium]
MGRRFGMLATIAVAVSSVAVTAAPVAAHTAVTRSATGPGRTGVARPFTVHVPPSYQPGVAAPLLVMLHGYAATSAVEESYLQLTNAADAHGMLYAHPDGTRDSTGSQFWNATDACCDFEGSGVDDSAYLNGVIDQIELTYNVDRRRVFIVGHSAGGFMAYRMACDHADQVAAVVSLEGATYADPTKCHPSEPVTALEIHGTADSTIAYDGGSSGGHTYPSAPATILSWATADGCTSKVDDPAPAPHAIDKHLPSATVRAYSTGCAPNGHAELWTLAGGTHVPDLTPTFAEQVVGYLLAHPKAQRPPIDGLSTGATSLTRPAAATAPMTFTIRLDRASAHAVTAHYQTVDGTALGLVDYTPTSGTVTIPAGQTSTTASVPIVGNRSDEPDKTFSLTLSAPTNADIGGPTGVATIRANHLLAGCPIHPTGNQRYVCHIYWDALGRQAESGGFTYWVNLLDHGTPRLQMATSYLRTPEARHVLVDRLYVFFLGRHGDAAGVSYWGDKLLHGATPDDIRAFLATSTEFWTKAGGTNQGFVKLLFSDVFRRQVDAGGLAYWTGRLDQGQSRAAVVDAFLHTDEGRAHVVGDIFLRFLRRYPTSAESAALVAQFQHGTSEIDIYGQTVASTEYFQRP